MSGLGVVRRDPAVGYLLIQGLKLARTSWITQGCLVVIQSLEDPVLATVRLRLQ